MRSNSLALRLVLSLLVVLLGSGSSFGQTHRILFVGNSYTFYNSMPRIFQAMAESRFPDQQFETKFVGGGGATLEKHWEVGQALREIQTGQWDYVVLQEQSTLGSKNLSDKNSWKQFNKYSRMFAEEVKKSGAETIFFMTWSRRDSRDQQEYLTTAYTNIANELNCKLAQVGTVWDSLRETETIDLYNEDGSHPSVEGSYLVALTLLSTIFEIQPQDTPGSLSGYKILRGGAIAKVESNLCDFPIATVQAIEKAVNYQYN